MTSLGRTAARALGVESAWEVCAVFRRCFYCRGRCGAVVCVGQAGIGAGPLNVRWAAPAAGEWDPGCLAPGDTVRCDGQTLRVKDRVVFSLMEAALWRPVRYAAACSPAALGRGVARLADAAARFPVRGGLQGLLPHVAAPGRWHGVPEAPLLRMAAPGILRLGRWLDESLMGFPRAAPPPVPEAEGLIGLGPGLTPSGDDALGGMLVALHAFGFSVLADRLAAAMLPRARQRTNAISYAHLACAAEGEGAEPLHELLHTLATPGAPGLEDRLRLLDAVGHTSGWDALAGAALALAAIAAHGAAPAAKAPPDGNGRRQTARE